MGASFPFTLLSFPPFFDDLALPLKHLLLFLNLILRIYLLFFSGGRPNVLVEKRKYFAGHRACIMCAITL